MKTPLVEAISKLDNCELVARMRKDTVACEEPKPKVPETRSPQAKVGEKIKLMDLFASKETEFLDSSILIYGQEQRIRCTVVDLLWKRDKRFKMRFVLVEILDTSGIRGLKRLILGSTDRSLSAKSIILAYAWRMKIERSFQNLNQHIGFSDYHFWSKAVPEFKKRKPGSPSPLEKDAHDKKLIVLCPKRVEMRLLVCLTLRSHSVGRSQTLGKRC